MKVMNLICSLGLEFGMTVPASIRTQLWQKLLAPAKQEDATAHSVSQVLISLY